VHLGFRRFQVAVDYAQTELSEHTLTEASVGHVQAFPWAWHSRKAILPRYTAAHAPVIAGIGIKKIMLATWRKLEFNLRQTVKKNERQAQCCAQASSNAPSQYPPAVYGAAVIGLCLVLSSKVAFKSTSECDVD
jgi:hypothetical protein